MAALSGAGPSLVPLRTTEPAANATSAPADSKAVGLWVLLAFAPSSLMLGATTYISTDLAAVPLLWVVPLAIYLLTFVLAFEGRGGGKAVEVRRFDVRIAPGRDHALCVADHRMGLMHAFQKAAAPDFQPVVLDPLRVLDLGIRLGIWLRCGLAG